MVKNNLKDIKVPELPKLKNGFVVVQEEAWNVLIQYIQEQTDVINSILTTVASTVHLNTLEFERCSKDILKLQSELGEIAAALEGEFTDD